jgi:thioredoxin-like negative regulator of GroEL
MELKSSSEVERLLTSKQPVAIFFYLEGCPHCMNMEQPWKDLSKEVQGTKFYKVESEYVPSKLGITGFPHFMKIQDGKQVKSIGGEMEKSALKSALFGLRGGRRTRRHRARTLTRRRRQSSH